MNESPGSIMTRYSISSQYLNTTSVLLPTLLYTVNSISACNTLNNWQHHRAFPFNHHKLGPVASVIIRVCRLQLQPRLYFTHPQTTTVYLRPATNPLTPPSTTPHQPPTTDYHHSPRHHHGSLRHHGPKHCLAEVCIACRKEPMARI